MISLVSLETYGQMENAYYGEIAVGKVIKHREGLLYDIPPVSIIIQGGKQIQTDGSKAWHDFWGYPRLERNLHVAILGDQEVLGYAFGAAPGIAFYLYRGKSNSVLLHMSAGFAYLTREYDPITNPTNNTIGSNLNNTTQVKLSYEFSLTKKVAFDLGVGITHYSNGLSSSPNGGINVIGLHLGFKPVISNHRSSKLNDPVMRKAIKRRWGINGFMSYGVSEYSVPGGPKYPIKNYTLGLYYLQNPFIKWHIGVDYEYAFSAYEFAIRNFQTEEKANDLATSVASYGAIEGIFGDISFRYQMGYYWDIIYGRPLDTPYSKFSISYNVPYEIYDVRPYFGILLKTHLAVADYVALQVGLEW